MRILVLSDSHGSTLNVRTAIAREKTAEVIIHLGDGADDVLQCPGEVGSRRVILLKGNVDAGNFGAELSVYTQLCGATVFACHGDRFSVRADTQIFERAARSREASVALYGHTHIQHYMYADGLHLLNPGAAKDGNYAVIEISDKGILCNLKQI